MNLQKIVKKSKTIFELKLINLIFLVYWEKKLNWDLKWKAKQSQWIDQKMQELRVGNLII